jgi:hypothetical protein
MKSRAHHLIAEIPRGQSRVEMTIGIDLGDVWKLLHFMGASLWHHGARLAKTHHSSFDTSLRARALTN